MKLLIPILLLLALTPAAVAQPSSEAPRQPLEALLTLEERAWLKDHPKLRVGFDAQFPPHSFVGAGGKLEGFAVDMWGVIAERTGLEVEERAEPWQDLLSQGRAKDVDAIATMVARADRREHFLFTKAYVHKSLVVMSRTEDTRFQDSEDLSGKKIAVVKGYQYVPRVLRRYPDAEPVYVDSILDALNAVSTGKADCTITFQAAAHHLVTKYLISNLKFVAVYDRSSSAESIGVRKDWPLLTSILDKALATISQAERLELAARWLPKESELGEGAQLELSASQEAWLEAHPVIRIGIDPEFHPFEFLDAQGRYQGISADYLNVIGRKLGVRFQVSQNLSWKEAVAKARARELDLLPALGESEERREVLDFSEPYVEFHRVIITRSDTPFLRGVEDLGDLKVAVQANSSHAGYLSNKTSIKALPYPTLQETLTAVSDGEVDAMVGNLASATYWIRRLNLTNLKVAAAAGKDVYTLHFAVRKDWPELTQILNRSVRALGQRERNQIADTWVKLRYDPQVDYGPLWQAAGGGLIVLLLLLGWNTQIRRHRDRENAARVATEKANADLEQLRAELEERVQDRTQELRLTQERFYRAQKLEALGTFVSGIVHDLNNLLAGIQGAVGLVKIQHESGEEIAEELTLALEACAQGSELVSQLMAFVRQEATELGPVDVADLAEKARSLAQTRAAQIPIDLAVAPGLELRGNYALLQQVLLNLLTNSQDALESTSDPRIELRASSEPSPAGHAEKLQSERSVRIEVWDNGEGISRESMDRLFDPFFTTKARGKGTGLGLAMAFGTVESHGGVIEAERGQPGTTFRIWLPEGDSSAQD